MAVVIPGPRDYVKADDEMPGMRSWVIRLGKKRRYTECGKKKRGQPLWAATVKPGTSKLVEGGWRNDA